MTHICGASHGRTRTPSSLHCRSGVGLLNHCCDWIFLFGSINSGIPSHQILCIPSLQFQLSKSGGLCSVLSEDLCFFSSLVSMPTPMPMQRRAATAAPVLSRDECEDTERRQLLQYRAATAAPVLSRDECEDIVRNMRSPARGASHPRNSRPTLLPTETFYPGKLWLCSCDWAHHEEFLSDVR